MVFTCASSWNGRKRASCTVQNLWSITQSYFHRAKQVRPTKHRETLNQRAANLMTKLNTPQPKSVSKNQSLSMRILLATSIALSLLATTSPAHAKPARAKNTTPVTQSSPKKKPVNKVTYQRSASEETTAERDRRMYRECRGMHNAGACRGYTRK